MQGKIHSRCLFQLERFDGGAVPQAKDYVRLLRGILLPAAVDWMRWSLLAESVWAGLFSNFEADSWWGGVQESLLAEKLINFTPLESEVSPLNETRNSLLLFTRKRTCVPRVPYQYCYLNQQWPCTKPQDSEVPGSNGRYNGRPENAEPLFDTRPMPPHPK